MSEDPNMRLALRFLVAGYLITFLAISFITDNTSNPLALGIIIGALNGLSFLFADALIKLYKRFVK